LRKSKVGIVLWFLAAIIAIGCAYAVSYFLSILIFKVTGTPSEFWRHIISGFLGLLLIWIFFWRRPNERDEGRKNIIKALDSIAQGDFNVLLANTEHDNFNELTDRINKIAKELGTMEHLRQDFITNISHEFQSPLTSIGGYAALLRKDGATLQQIEYATIIEEESKRLSKLSDNLLLLSSLETEDTVMTKTDYQLDRQIEDVVLLLEHQWSLKRIEPETNLPKTSFNGNEDLLKQVWINLLANAIKFTPENGEITVSLMVDDENVVCAISDSGIGITPADQMHIFERFYKAEKSRSRSFGGNGLGLSISKKIIELHGGNITVESTLGKGTSFKVVLPNKTLAE